MKSTGPFVDTRTRPAQSRACARARACAGIKAMKEKLFAPVYSGQRANARSGAGPVVFLIRSLERYTRRNVEYGVARAR